MIVDYLCSFWPALVLLLVVWSAKAIIKSWKQLLIASAFSLSLAKAASTPITNEYNNFYSLGGDYTTTHVAVIIPPSGATGTYCLYIDTWETDSTARFNRRLVYFTVKNWNGSSGVNSSAGDGGYNIGNDYSTVYFDVQNTWIGEFGGNAFADTVFGQTCSLYTQGVLFSVDQAHHFCESRASSTLLCDHVEDDGSGGVRTGPPPIGSIAVGAHLYTGRNAGVFNISLEVPPTRAGGGDAAPGQDPDADDDTGTVPNSPEYDHPSASPPTETPSGTPPLTNYPTGDSPTNNAPNSDMSVAPSSSFQTNLPGYVNNGDGTSTSTGTRTSTSTSNSYFTTNVVNGTNVVTQVTATTVASSDTSMTPPALPSVSNAAVDPGGGAGAQPPSGMPIATQTGDAIASALPAIPNDGTFWMAQSDKASSWTITFPYGGGKSVSTTVDLTTTPFPELRSLFLVCFNLGLIFAIYKFMRV